MGWGSGKDVERIDRGDLAWLKPIWFAGNHSDIGGSYPEDESRLSDIALDWMMGELGSISEAPKVNKSLIRTFPDPAGLHHDEVKSSRDAWLPRWVPFRFGWKAACRKIHPEAPLHPSVLARFEQKTVPQYDRRAAYRPEGLRHHDDVKQHF